MLRILIRLYFEPQNGRNLHTSPFLKGGPILYLGIFGSASEMIIPDPLDLQSTGNVPDLDTHSAMQILNKAVII